MRFMQFTKIVAFMAFGGFSNAAIAQDTDNKAPVSLKGFERSDCFISGTRRRVECATLQVPLYHDDPSAGTIEIFATILPAKSGKPEADPFVLFAGGPGQAASELVPIVRGVLGDIWQDRDIVLIDQRGTGRSTPLDCVDGELLFDPAEIREWAAACLAGFDVDTRAFNLAESVHDMAKMLKALGYSKVNTYGVSYGTRTSAYFLKTYPDMVRSMTVDGIAPPDYSLFETAPKAADDAFSALISDCLASSDCASVFPDTRGQINRLLTAAKAGGLRYQGANPLTGEAVDIPVTPLALTESIRSVLYGVQNAGFLPYAIDQAEKGDLTVLFNQSFALQEKGKMYLGMTLSFLCGEDIDRITPEQAANRGAGTFVEAGFYSYYANLCSIWTYKPASDYPLDMRAPWAGDTPVLVLSGQHDPVTPASGGDHIIEGLTNARHITVPGTGHGTFRASCVPFLMNEFIDTLDLDALDASCTERVQRPPVILGPNGNTIQVKTAQKASR